MSRIATQGRALTSDSNDTDAVEPRWHPEALQVQALTDPTAGVLMLKIAQRYAAC
jgi:hypothetical protein